MHSKSPYVLLRTFCLAVLVGYSVQEISPPAHRIFLTCNPLHTPPLDNDCWVCKISVGEVTTFMMN